VLNFLGVITVHMLALDAAPAIISEKFRFASGGITMQGLSDATLLAADNEIPFAGGANG
jgi:hypothetical protein